MGFLQITYFKKKRQKQNKKKTFTKDTSQNGKLKEEGNNAMNFLSGNKYTQWNSITDNLGGSKRKDFSSLAQVGQINDRMTLLSSHET